jgi:hypothetical protein
MIWIFFMDYNLLDISELKKQKDWQLFFKNDFKYIGCYFIFIFFVRLLLFISSKFWKILYYFLYVFISSWILCTNNKQVVVELMKLL